MCVHIRHSLAIPPIPPTRVRKNAGLPRLYPQKEIRVSMYCVATRHVPTLNPAVGGYRFDAVDAVRPQEWSDDRLRSVKRVGKPREGSLDPLREMAEKPEESQGALSDCNWTAERKAKLCRGSRMKRDTTVPPTILLPGRQATLKPRSTEHHRNNWDCNRECNFYAFGCCIKFAYVPSEK